MVSDSPRRMIGTRILLVLYTSGNVLTILGLRRLSRCTPAAAGE
jgi:hypothetical protein